MSGVLNRVPDPDAPPLDSAREGAGRGLPAFRRLAAATAGASLLLVALGGAVRATDSGLACPDWPRCFGMWIPPGDLNMWIEHTHRLVAGVVGLLVASLAIWSIMRFRSRRDLVVPAVVALGLVVVQSLLGALVVLHLLRAELVTTHLGMAMIVVACLLVLAVNASRPAQPRTPWSGFARGAAAVAGLTFVQILVGGHVTGIAAGLVWTDFPLMDGRVIPALGTEREIFHFTHRGLAFVLFLAVIWLALAAVRERRRCEAAGEWTAAHRWLVKLPMWAATLVVVQIGLGVANLWTRTSYLTVTPHLAVASWIWAVLVLTVLLSRRLGAGAPAGNREEDPEGAPS